MLGTATGLGIVAGMRTMTPAAVLAHRLTTRTAGRRRLLPALFDALAVLEYVTDKHPDTPPRTDTPALAGRALSGALSGGLWSRRQGASAGLGSALGAVGAVVGAYGFLALRRRADRVLSDRGVGLLEDGLALAGAWALTRSQHQNLPSSGRRSHQGPPPSP